MTHIYDRYTRFMILFGMLFMHILCFGLGIFFVIRFLIAEETRDAGAIILIAFLSVMQIFVDCLLWKLQLYQRMFLKCQFSDRGIACRGIGWKPFFIPWKEICVYGVFGYTPNTGMGFITLSMDENEVFNRQTALVVTRQRIIFEIYDPVMKKLKAYMPGEMFEKLQYSISRKEDCFHRVPKKKRK